MQTSLKVLQELVANNKNGGEMKASTSSAMSSSGASTSGAGQSKTSKAAILRDAAGLIRSQREARAKLDAEINRLQAEIDGLQNSIK